MKQIEILINGELYSTKWIVEEIRSLCSEEYDDCPSEDKKAWVVSQFKETINEEIDKLFKEDK